MKKKLILLFGVMLLLAVVGSFIINTVNQKASEEATTREDKLNIVTTFYPVYMIGLNLADQIDTVEVKSLTELNTGCLHDYQLTTADMKLIANADVMIINGGGMEGFLEDIATSYPKLTIIDASEGISLLSTEEDQELGIEHEEEHDHSGYNSHIWLDPTLYIQQIENVREGLNRYIQENKSSLADITNSIDTNAQAYINEAKTLESSIDEVSISITTDTSKQVQEKAVIFHDAFAYLANRVGMEVAFAVPLDSDTSLSAGDIAEIINKVKEEKIKYLFTEEQYSDSIANQIAAETGAKVYIIDSAVTGDGSKDSYLKSMQDNIAVLKEAIDN